MAFGKMIVLQQLCVPPRCVFHRVRVAVFLVYCYCLVPLSLCCAHSSGSYIMLYPHQFSAGGFAAESLRRSFWSGHFLQMICRCLLTYEFSSCLRNRHTDILKGCCAWAFCMPNLGFNRHVNRPLHFSPALSPRGTPSAGEWALGLELFHQQESLGGSLGGFCFGWWGGGGTSRIGDDELAEDFCAQIKNGSYRVNRILWYNM